MEKESRKPPIFIASILGLIMLAVLALPSFAQVVKNGQTRLDQLTFSNQELRVSQTFADSDAVAEPLANRDDLARFRSQYGAAWHFLVDQRTGRLNLVDGGAIPFIPGSANKLRWQDFGTADCQSPACISSAEMESLARDFLTRNRGVFQLDPEELVLDPAGAAPIGNSIYFLRFQWTRGGVPVEGGSVFFAINNGNLIQVGLTNIGDVTVDPKPSISTARAWEAVKSYVGGMTDKDEVVNQGTLAILPITPKGLDPDGDKVPFGKMIDYALVYKLAFQRSGVLGTWEATVDAHSGELLSFQDSNVYGHVKGGVYKTDAPQVEVSEPFPKADYGAALFADESGNYSATNGTCTLTGLNLGGVGVAGGVKINDNCGPISLASTGTGLIDFGSSAGTDCTTPGFGGAGNTHAARTQYWNVSEIKMKAISYLPNNTWIQGQVQDNVNIGQACNAYWLSPTLNFFQTGTLPQGPTNPFGPFDQTCGNTGELPGVSLHEWGHGMDANDGSGGGLNSPGEARADWTAILQTHQSCAGGGFFTARNPVPAYGLNCGGYGNPCTSCTGIRDVDFAQHATPTPWTPQNFNSVWGPGFMNVCNFGGSSPCGWEPHCEAGIATQALWDFVNRDLVGAPTNLDLNTAWQLSDRLFYTGMPQSTSMYTCNGPVNMKTSNGCGAGSLYTVMRAIDDDGDGVANGTPHAAAIFAALNRHGIACGAAGDPVNKNQTSCPSLTTPTVSATADSHTVHLSWTTGGANATRYFVLRNETGCNAGFTKIATVNAPTLVYDDTTVVHGLTYYYRIQAATANDACVSTMSNCSTISVSLPADQDFYVRDWTSSVANFDTGEEPSTNNVFWHTSDVWNHGTNAPGSPNASGWYDTDNMYAGALTLGDNYAFVRVHRNATGSPATVTAHFLISPFGTGSAFQDADVAPDPTIDFAPGDTEQVLATGYYWHQDAIASTHACLAVQISAPSDPFAPPSLLGKTPGPDDYIIINDNNKAQRNLDVSLNVMHFAGMGFALVHNSALVPRDVVLRFESPAAERLQGAQIGVVGSKTVDFRSGGTVTLPGMQPGENRWISLTYKVASSDPVAVDFTELDKGSAVNGFTILAKPVSLADVIVDNLRNHVQVFNRLAAAFGATEGTAEAEAATKLLRTREITPAQYLDFLKRHVEPMDAILQPLVAKGGTDDVFAVLESLRNLSAAAAESETEQAASEHGMLLRRLDSLATLLQKAQGDPADVLQMVRWQEALYRARPDLHRLECSERVIEESQEFVRTYSQKEAQESYPALLRSLSACFHETAKLLEKDQQRLEEDATALEKPGLSLAALEKAHREFLLALQDAAQ
ncbi:MAG: trimeric autotransporter adhesin [Acidobacteriota bacterium]|nr:trimeric autotransporter adhesin [Acidobacteriota bacterium]